MDVDLVMSCARPQPLMAKPPAGSSLLFGALADSGRIKQHQNGSYRMVMEGVDEIDWSRIALTAQNLRQAIGSHRSSFING